MTRCTLLNYFTNFVKVTWLSFSGQTRTCIFLMNSPPPAGLRIVPVLAVLLELDTCRISTACCKEIILGPSMIRLTVKTLPLFFLYLNGNFQHVSSNLARVFGSAEIICTALQNNHLWGMYQILCYACFNVFYTPTTCANRRILSNPK